MTLPLAALRNSNFLSNHSLEHRLPLEPAWNERKGAAGPVLERLLSLWRVEGERVALYGDEAGLEEKFIQPVFEILGWHLKYQTFLNRREPGKAPFAANRWVAASRFRVLFSTLFASVGTRVRCQLLLLRSNRGARGNFRGKSYYAGRIPV
jgi:hypothetical protein